MITKYHISANSGHQTIVELGKNKATWLALEVVRLEQGDIWRGDLIDVEAALIPLSGRMTVNLSNSDSLQWKGVGSRSDIFSGLPWAFYAPRNSKLQVMAESKLELAIAKAPCDQDFPPTVVKSEEVKVVSSGAANWRRDVRLVIGPGSKISQRLIVGETINPPGNWSGIPPHKHDEVSGKENFLEEFYWYKAKPNQGYGVQLGYKDGNEESYVIHDDDVFVMQNGYHPTVAAPGTTLGYLWVLSGEIKTYSISTDPQFDWVANAEAVLKELQR